jgi:hypothetical protein
VFVVYGNKGTHGSYAPKWLEGIAKCLGVLPILSVIRCGSQVGLVVGLYDTIEDIEADLNIVVNLQEQLVRKFPRSTIALAGRLPSLLHRAGGLIKAPVVGGWTGTLCAMRGIALACAQRYSETKGNIGNVTETITDASTSDGSSTEGCSDSLDDRSSRMSNHGTGPEALTVSVLGGAGFVGAKLVQDLAKHFRKVIAFDLRYEESVTTGNILETSDLERLRDAHITMIFTPCGDDAAPCAPYLSPGSIVADDTHPCVSQPVRAKFRAAKVSLLKAAATNLVHPVSFYPKLPNFYSDSVPGCLLEALVVSRRGHGVTEDFEKFCQEAEHLGFAPQLMENLHEPLLDTEKSRRDLHEHQTPADIV